MFLKYNPMSQTKYKVKACMLKKKIVKATKRKYAMLFYAVSVSICLSICKAT